MTAAKPKGALWFVAIALAYGVQHHLGLLFVDPVAHISPVWPASGVGLAALLLTPRAQQRSLFALLAAVSFSANLLVGFDLVSALSILCSNMLALRLALWFVDRAGSQVTFRRVPEVTGLLWSATLGCMSAAVVASATMALRHGVDFLRVHRTWWIADGLGMLIVTPLLVTWVRAEQARERAGLRQALEPFAFLLLWCIATWLTFNRDHQLSALLPGPYVLIGLSAWPALRLGQRWVTLALAILATIAIARVRAGGWTSPWGGASVSERLMLLQVYLGFAAGSALLFAASVNERRQAQRASELAEQRSRRDTERLELALGAASICTWEWSLGSNEVFWSSNSEAVLARPAENFERTFSGYMALVHADDRAEIERAIEAVMKRGSGTYTSQHRLLGADGAYRWMESKGRLDCDAAGKPFRMAGTLVDISQRKRAEHAIMAGDLLLKQCIKYTPAAVAMFDTNMCYLQASDRWLADYHLQGQELAGRSHYEVFPDVPERWKEVHRRVLAGAVERNDDDPFPRESGGTEWLQWEVRPWHRPDDSIGGVVMFTQVVTERKQAEERNRQLQEQLRQAQKLEALGTLAGGIAHDFNNILSAIVAYTQIAQMENPGNADLQSHLGEVLHASSRAANLVQQILSFSRQQRQERKTLAIAPVCKEALKLLRSTLPATIEIREQIASNLPDVLADPTQMHQVLMNLCTNASHAMKGRGELKLELSRYRLDDPSASPHLELRVGEYLRLSVSDTGEGIDEAVLPRIFEPFFTTKASGEGTGLGLAVVHGIVKEHEGVITATSQRGEGATFTMYLPAASKAETVADEELADVPMGHGQRILFVDDELALCTAARHLLTRLGYQPRVFQDPEAAWQAFQEAPHACDAVVTDLTMPQRTGLELANDMLRLRPQLPIILTSGYSATLTTGILDEMGIRELVYKPLDYRAMASALSRALPRHLDRSA